MSQRRLQIFLDQDFSDLDGIERRPLPDVVRDDPHIDAVGDGFILANPSDEGFILARSVDGQSVFGFLRIIHDDNPGGLGENLSHFIR